MGRTYCANKSDDKIDLNISGTQIVSRIVKQFGLDHDKSKDQEFPNPPWEATAERAKKLGESPKVISDEQIKDLFPTIRKVFDGSPEDFVEFVRDWQTFLLTCGGYTTL